MFSNVIHDATKLDNTEIRKQLGAIILPTEVINLSYRIIRDLIVFTDSRVIIAKKDEQNATKIIHHHSFYYLHLSRFNFERSEHDEKMTNANFWLVNDEIGYHTLQIK